MLVFLEGTYFPAKKEYISEKICSLLNEGERVYLIVPEQASFDRDRDFLFTYGEKLSNKLTVTSFTHLSRDVLESNGLRVKPEADEAARNVLMSLAVRDCETELEIYRNHSGKPSLVKKLLEEYSEIRQAGFITEDLMKVSESLPEGILKKKTGELSRIFPLYEASLGERFSDASDNIRVMQEFLSRNKIFSDAYIFFDDFRGFTGAQIKLMEEIMAGCKACYVSVSAPDSMNAYDSTAFTHAVKNCNILRQCADKRGVPCKKIKIEGTNPSPALSVLEDSLFCDEKNVYEEETDDVAVIFAKNKYDECDAVALEIKKLLDEKGLRCRDISITERGSLYTKAMTAALKKYGIPVFEDKRVPLFQYPLVKMLLSAVSIAAFGFTTEEMFNYIKTGICGISAEECSLLENYVYIWQIDRSGWLRAFTGHPDGFGEDNSEKAKERLSVIESLRERVVTPLTELKRKLDKGNGGECCRALYEFLVRTDASANFLSYAKYLHEHGKEGEALECSAVWDIIMSSLDALYEAIGERKITARSFYELLKIILSAGDVGRIPAGVDEIVIGKAGRTRHLEPEAVFVLGCNEGVFPCPPVSGGLFTSAERRILSDNEFHLENIPENMYSEERMIAYSVLVNAKKRLYVSYSLTGTDSAALEPSEIISEIKASVPRAAHINASSLSSLDKIGSVESAFEECASVFGENTVYSASLKEYVKNSPFAHKFCAVEAVVHEEPAVIKDGETAVELFGKDMYISPSKAEVFYSCAFKYFCQYGMNVKKLHPADLDARINGLLIHHLLEKILLGRKNEELICLTGSELREEISEKTEAFITDYMGGREDKSVLLNRSLDRAKVTAFEIISRMIREFSVSKFSVADVELEISEGKDMPPYRKDLPDGGSITVGGKVDRVDIYEDENKAYIRVVDYKTGGKDFKLSDVFDGLNMQMLIYLMCIWDNGKERYGDVVPAGILYVPANSSGDYLPRSADSDEIAAQRLRNGRMNGMILEDEKILSAMEKDCAGIFIDARIDDKGRLQGSFLSLNGFRLLHELTDKKLTDMGTALHEGRIGALPLIGGAYKYTCDYCDYKDICRRDEQTPVREPLGLNHEKAVNKLKGEENNG